MQNRYSSVLDIFGRLPAGVRHRIRQVLKIIYWSATLQLFQQLRRRLDTSKQAETNDKGRFTLARLCDSGADETGPRILDIRFKVSVLTPTFNTEPRFLRELYQTLRNQKYSNWEWIIVDDGSLNVNTIIALREIQARQDPRVMVTLLPENCGISRATNAALFEARGTHIALVDHDDLLSRDALLAVFDSWKTDQETHIFYTDECKLLPDGTLAQFWAKPDWSPSYLENTMCLGHLSVYKTEFIRSLGGFRSEYDGTQDFDLALRASRCQPKVAHISVFCYLWRIIPGSAAADLSEKSYAIERQHKAVQDYATQQHPGAIVVSGWGAGYWRIKYPLPSPTPLLSYVIPIHGSSAVIHGRSVDLIHNCIRSFSKKRFYPNAEYVVVHSGNLTPNQVNAFKELRGVRLVQYKYSPPNISEKINLGVLAAEGEYVCLLDDEVEAITERGGEELVAYLAANSSVGAIGAMCLFEDGTVQQNGIVMTSAGPAYAGAGQPAEFGGHQAMLRCRREAFAVGGAIVLKKSVYTRYGGFDEQLPHRYNGVDFCLRLRKSGLTCVIDPSIRVYHYDGITKSKTSTVERERFFLKHPGIEDPYFSRWFKQDSVTYEITLQKAVARLPFGPWLDRRIASRSANQKPDIYPKMSVGVSVYNQSERFLEEMYSSVLMQTYDNFELIILNNASTNPETLGWLDRVRGEGRAIVVAAETNLGSVGCIQKILDMITGDFFVAVGPDDFLSVDALQVMVNAIGRHPGRKLFYSDEYRSDLASVRFSPFFKPDFDPVLLMSLCYPARLLVLDAEYLRSIKAYSSPQEPCCPYYDTLTRALASGEEAVHVRELVYAWRIHPGSTATCVATDTPQSINSQLSALNRYLDARRLAEKVVLQPNNLDRSHRLWRVSAAQPLPGMRLTEVDEIWGDRGGGLEGLLSCAEDSSDSWIAILSGADRESAARELSAVAWLDDRIVAVSGLLMNSDDSLCWSGGVFMAGGCVFDPYSGQSLEEGGYQGQLWCQRCVDVAAPINVLIRIDALRRAAKRPGVKDADSLMTTLGIDAHEGGNLIAVTPHLRTQIPRRAAAFIPLDRRGLALGLPSLTAGSRWYNGHLEAERPYLMPDMAYPAPEL